MQYGSLPQAPHFRLLSCILPALFLALTFAKATGVPLETDVVLSVRGPTEPFVATLSGGNSHFVGYRESQRGENVRFRSVPAGEHLLRLETHCGAVLERIVKVSAKPGEKAAKVEVSLQQAVVPKDWNGGQHTTSVRDLSWPSATRKALSDAWKRMEKGELPAARACLRRALTLSPDCRDAWTNLALVAEWDQSLEEAERFHREALRLEPDAFATNLNLSELLERLGKVAEAVEVGQRALALRPRDLGVNLHMGTLYSHLHRFDRAIPHFVTAKQIHPESLGTAQILLGVAYVETGSPEKAIVEFDEWLARFPDHPNYRLVADTRQDLASGSVRVANH